MSEKQVAEKLRVWGIGTARTLRVHWMLLELGLDYEVRPILTRTTRMDDPEFTRLSSRSKIPLLEDGELMIGESAAIVSYLGDRYRDVRVLSPQAPGAQRARHDELCFFAMSELDAPLYIIRRHEGLSDIYGESSVAVASARAYFLRSAGEIERRLADGRPHLLGEEFSAADLMVKSCLDWAGFAAIELPEALARYSARIGERPAYGRAIAVNFPPEAFAALQGKPVDGSP